MHREQAVADLTNSAVALAVQQLDQIGFAPRAAMLEQAAGVVVETAVVMRRRV